MPSRREFLLLQLLCTFTLTKVILTGPQLVTAPTEKRGNANKTTDLSRRQPLWFDYPDSDKEKILAIYKLIGEQPEFVAPSTFPHLLRYILVGSIILILLFFLYQIISKVVFKKSNAG